MSTNPHSVARYMPVIRITPHKITGSYIDLEREHLSKTNRTSFTKQVANNHGRNISFKTKLKIEDSIAWLVYLSKKKTAFNPKTLTKFQFRINFVTLTLPSLQAHEDSTITAKCLNHFLTECRSTFNLRNYVWRAEPQGIGNIHFHFVTDTYMNAYIVREIWNRCINKLGYVDRYHEKFKNMNFAAYCKYMQRFTNSTKSQLLQSFKYGIATNWKKPNTTDIHSTRKIKNIAAYISKYVTKNVVPINQKTVPISRKERSAYTYELKERRLGCRLWGQSQSLSKIVKPIFEVDSHISKFVDYLRKHFEHRYFVHDFGSVFRVHMSEYSHVFTKFLRDVRDTVIEVSNYSPSSQAEQKFYNTNLFQLTQPPNPG